MNITELLVTQKNVDEISAEFGLTEEQTLEAMAAVIPAFSEGLKRQTTTPEGAASFITALSSGQHAQYVDNPATAMNETGIQEGNAILGHLFGTKNVSRAVAKQAAVETGISPSMFKTLLPVMASLVMGSLFKGATSQQSAASDDAVGDALSGAVGGGLLGQILSGLAEGLLNGAKSAQPRRRTPSRRRSTSNTGTLQDILEQVMGEGSTSKRQRKPRPRSKTNARPRRNSKRSSGGLGGIIDEMLSGSQSGRSNRRKKQPSQPRTRRSSRNQTDGLGEIFGDLFEPGGKTKEGQRKSTESIFDEFLKG